MRGARNRCPKSSNSATIEPPTTEFRIEESGLAFDAGRLGYAWFRLADLYGRSHYRAVACKELTYLPIETRDDPDVLGKQWAALRGLYNADVDFLYTAVGVYQPQHLGVMQFYGAAAEAQRERAAAGEARRRMAAVEATLANYPLSRLQAPDGQRVQMTLRHLGPAVALAADERGIAVRVQADTGLAGLLRPGMAVGVVATLPEANGGMYAKALLEGLRVLYVPPDFQARPYTPATAQLRVSNDGTSSPPVVSASPQQTVQEGVVVLAASTQPTTILYRWPEGLVESLAATGEVDIQTGVELGPAALPPARLVVPVELLAALNAADASFTLVMLPETPATYTTTGLTLAQILVRSAEEGQP